MNRSLFIVFFLWLLFLSGSSVAKANQNLSGLTTATRNLIVLKEDQPFSDQLTHKNCIYVIRDSFDLKGSGTGKTVTIPANCVLRFEGGLINNGIVSFSDTYLEGTIQLGVNCQGTITNKEGLLSWFSDSHVNSNNLNWLLNNCYKTDIDKNISLDSPVNMGDRKIELYSSNNSVIRVNCKPAYINDVTYCAWFFSKNSSSVCIHDLVIDFENKQYSMPKGDNNVYVSDAIRIVAPQMCRIYNVHVKNYGKTKGSLNYDSFCAIAIHPNGYSVIDVHDLIFNNIKVVGDGNRNVTPRSGGITQCGMGECVRIYYNNANTDITSPVNIYNVSCVNCYSVDSSGKPITDDFDCIHINALDSNHRLTLCKVSNCYFEGINKRAIKAQATNVHIDGVVYKNPNRIEGLSVLIQPFGEKCIIENVYAFPNTNGSIIDGRFSPEIAVCNSIINAIPDYNCATLTGIVDCSLVSNCVIKNVPRAIVGYNNGIGIKGIESRKYYGNDYAFFQFSNIIENCRFDNCDQLYVRKNSLQDCIKCKFSNCSFSNSAYITVGKETEITGCQFVNDKETKYELFSIIGEEKDVNRLLIKDCIIDIKNNSRPLMVDRGGISLRHFDFIISNSQIVTNGPEKPFLYRNTIRDGKSEISFDGFIIKDTKIDNYTLIIQEEWTGLFSVVNSNVPLEKGVIPRDVCFYDASFHKGDTRIHLDGVRINPDYNCLPLDSHVFAGQPAAGTFFFQNGIPTWSNGAKWVDAAGAVINE